MADFKKLTQGIADGESFTTLLKYTTNLVATLALYVTIALALALVIWAILVRNRDENYLLGVRKTMKGIIIGYSVGVISTIGSLRLLRDVLKNEIDLAFWLMLGLFALIVVGVVTIVVLKEKHVKFYKWIGLAFLIVTVAYVVVLLCVLPPKDADYMPQSSWQMYLVSAILVGAIVTLSLVCDKRTDFDSKSLSYAAICIALSFALSYIKFFSLTQGGSVTFASLFPLALYSFMFGTRRGVVAGVVYGLLQFIQSPQPYHVMQILLDYPVAFGAIGLSGMARSLNWFGGKNCSFGGTVGQFAVGTTVAVLFRYAAHVASGYFVFYTWAGDQHPLAHSLVYNTFTLVDLAIVLAVGVLALSAKSFRRIVLLADVSQVD